MDFTSFRPLLFSIAYRMLGSVADAEDIVQDAYLRVQGTNWSAIENPRAYAATIVTRLCIDHLRSAHSRKETPAGVRLPEPAGALFDDSFNASELAESLSIAFLTMLQNLAPTQRAAFILYEVFDFDYSEIADIVGKTSLNVRQIVSRARKSIGGKARFQVSIEDVRNLVARFVKASQSGDITRVMELLAPDVALYADGGLERPRYGRLRAATRPLKGSERVARFIIAAQSQAPAQAINEIGIVNYAPAVLTRVEGRLVAVVSFDVAEGRVHNLFIIADPQKLQRLEARIEGGQLS